MLRSTRGVEGIKRGALELIDARPCVSFAYPGCQGHKVFLTPGRGVGSPPLTDIPGPSLGNSFPGPDNQPLMRRTVSDEQQTLHRCPFNGSLAASAQTFTVHASGPHINAESYFFR